jgi:processive 1,2-diacylglycerol beta-glucosyltransferase
VICGRNKKVRKQLKRRFARKYKERLSVMGFVSDIEKIMAASDLLIMRASPNSVMEAVAMRVPIIVFGQLAGQEKHNPDVLVAHGLAVYCPEISDLPDCTAALLANGGLQAEIMREMQRIFAPTDAADETAKLIHDWIDSFDFQMECGIPSIDATICVTN